jgi:hypothetical protein
MSAKLTRHICISCASEFAALPSYRGLCRECNNTHIEVKNPKRIAYPCPACRGDSWTPWTQSDMDCMDTRHCRFCGHVEFTRNDGEGA